MTIVRSAAAASLLVGVVVIVVVVRRAGADVSAVDLLLSPRAHLFAFLAFTVHVVCRGLRVSILARGLGERLGLDASIAAQLAGDAAGAATPMRIGSDPAKLMLMQREGIRIGPGAAVLAGEILLEITVLTAVAAAAALLLPSANGVALGALAYTAVVMSTTMTAVRLARVPGAEVPDLLRRLGVRTAHWSALRYAGHTFAERARDLTRLRARTIALLLGITAAHMMARLAILPLLVLPDAAIVDIGPLIAWPLVLLYAGALVPAPAGGGAVELGFAAALAARLPPELLAAALVWWRVYTFHLNAIGGGLVLVLNARLRRARTTA